MGNCKSERTLVDPSVGNCSSESYAGRPLRGSSVQASYASRLLCGNCSERNAGRPLHGSYVQARVTLVDPCVLTVQARFTLVDACVGSCSRESYAGRPFRGKLFTGVTLIDLCGGSVQGSYADKPSSGHRTQARVMLVARPCVQTTRTSVLCLQ